MMEAQQDYFKQQNQHRLKIAKIKEQKVNQLLQPYIKQGIIKPRKTTVINTNTLFT
jgi:hypothetical protein